MPRDAIVSHAYLVGIVLDISRDASRIDRRLHPTKVTFLVLVVASEEWSLVAFALGQTAYGLTMLILFMIACRDNLSFRPKQVTVTVHDQ